MPELLTIKMQQAMKKIKIILFLSFLSVSFYACYYDKADLLYPVGISAPCADSVGTVSYLQKVVPILQNQCYGCHNAASASGGIVMGTYATDKAIATNGKLYGSISFAAGFSAMPKGGAKMNSCQLATIKKWIDGGALNN